MIEKKTCEECEGEGTFEEVEPGGKVLSVCAECKGEGTMFHRFVCDSHPNQEVQGDKGMCWICIGEDDDYRKHRRRVYG